MKNDKNEGSITILEEKEPNVQVLSQGRQSMLFPFAPILGETVYMIPPYMLSGHKIDKDLESYQKALVKIIEELTIDQYKKVLGDYGFYAAIPFKEIKRVDLSEDKKNVTLTYHSEELQDILPVGEVEVTESLVCQIYLLEENQKARLVHACGIEFIVPVGEELYFPYLLF